MYCPRCGSQNTDTTKFCRQCGLPIAQVTDYVSTGGTGALARAPYQPPPSLPLIETSEMLALKHKRTLMTLGVCIAPVIFAILSDEVLKVGDIAGIPFLLIPIGIVWVRSHYKMQLRRLEERQLQEYYARQQHQQAMSQQAPGPKLIIQEPSEQAPIGQPRFDAPRTNPLAESYRDSVVEEATRKLPEH
ncbi:MAG: zinc ribbon domain-containing protein [Chloracidobacterium sp.]|nr:zinc ribbon domain-containing protein [Chloracidobacterium sp.]